MSVVIGMMLVIVILKMAMSKTMATIGILVLGVAVIGMGSGGPGRHKGRSYRDRTGPYDRPSKGGQPSSYDRY